MYALSSAGVLCDLTSLTTPERPACPHCCWQAHDHTLMHVGCSPQASLPIALAVVGFACPVRFSSITVAVTAHTAAYAFVFTDRDVAYPSRMPSPLPFQSKT